MQVPEKAAELIYRRSLPKIHKDARLYASHGDNHWGCAISHRDAVQLSDRLGVALGSRLSVSGHVTPRPRDGDLLLVGMASGRWAVFILDKVKLCHDPQDMFFASARGPLRYASAEETPKTDFADEFVKARRHGHLPLPDELPDGVAPALSYQADELVLFGGEKGRVLAVSPISVLVEDCEGRKHTLAGVRLAELSHIPEPPPFEGRPGQRISPLAD